MVHSQRVGVGDSRWQAASLPLETESSFICGDCPDYSRSISLHNMADYDLNNYLY